MQANSLRAIVATSTLDLGIDWGDVDLVVHIGSPKGASRLAQRIGRANHRMDEASKAILVPANRFEVMECQAALDANYLGAQDTPPVVDGGARRALPAHSRHGRLRRAVPRRRSLCRDHQRRALCRPRSRETFDRAVISSSPMAATRCKSYERYARIRKLTKDGHGAISHPSVAQQYRLNCGTIIEAPMLNIRITRKEGRACARRAGARQDRGVFHRGAGARRHVPVRRQGAAGSRASTRTTASSPRPATQSQGARLCRRQVSDDDLSVRTGAQDARRPAGWDRLPDQVSDWLSDPEGEIRRAGPRQPAGRDLSARQPVLSWSPTRSRAGWRTRRCACC
jgi:ATP-dependent Lhr-like helicase